MDVALQLLETSHDGVPRSAMFEARQHLHETREARRGRMLKKISLKKIERSLDELVEAAAAEDDSGWRRILATRLARRASRLRTAVGESGALYVPERLHAVRLASKKLRYALELAAEGGVREAAKLAVTIRRTQVTLGALQDRHVLLREVNDAAAKVVEMDEAVNTPRQGLQTLAARLEQAGRELHGQFLAQRDDLAAATAAVRERVVPELLRAGRTPARASLKPRRPAAKARQAS
jgi:CHAD domain-containing protein